MESSGVQLGGNTTELFAGKYGANNNLAFRGIKPTDNVGSKCYIFLPGTGQDVQKETYIDTFMEHMVQKGFCAATMNYSDNSIPEYAELNEEKIKAKVGELFADNETSAIGKLKAHCACDHIVAHGFSQGAHLALMAHDESPKVEGVLMFSGGCEANLFDNCEYLHSSTLSKDKIRDISAQNDGTLGCGFADNGRTAIHQVKLTTKADCDPPDDCAVGPKRTAGKAIDSQHDCPAGDGCKNQCKCTEFQNECFNKDKGGYYILKDETYGRNHTWFLQSQPGPYSVWEEALTTTEPFNVLNNLDWLASQVR